MSYHFVKPNAERPQYLPSETVDFIIKYDTMNLVPHVRISGTLHTTVADGVKKIYIDGMTGADSLFQYFTTSLNGMVVESLNEYPRYVRMKQGANQTPTQNVQLASNICSLRVSDSLQTKQLLFGAGDRAVSFSVVPDICLNNANRPLNFKKDGEVKITFQLPVVSKVLFGDDVGEATYHLTDLQLEYRLVKAQSPSKPLEMIVKQMVRQTLNSNHTTLGVIIPIPSHSIAMSVIKVSNEADVKKNALTGEYIKVDSLEFLFNDNNAMGLAYPLENDEEIIYNYLKTFNGTLNNSVGYSQLVPASTKENNWGFGIEYGAYIKNKKVTLDIQSEDVDGGDNKLSCYMYFKGLISV